MTLAPYYVLWGFSALALAVVLFGGLWLVARDAAGAALARLWLSDGVAMWLAFAAAYHTLFFVVGPYGAVMEERAGIWLLWAFVAAYLALRLIPSPLRNATAMLALAVVAWAWSIGAGYQYLEGMDQDAAMLREAPERIFTATSPEPRPLRKALFLHELREGQRRRTAELLAALEGDTPVEQAKLSSALLLLVPELIEHFNRDLSRLRTYQVLQLLLLAALLLGWGFGHRPHN